MEDNSQFLDNMKIRSPTLRQQLVKYVIKSLPRKGREMGILPASSVLSLGAGRGREGEIFVAGAPVLIKNSLFSILL